MCHLQKNTWGIKLYKGVYRTVDMPEYTGVYITCIMRYKDIYKSVYLCEIYSSILESTAFLCMGRSIWEYTGKYKSVVLVTDLRCHCDSNLIYPLDIHITVNIYTMDNVHKSWILISIFEKISKNYI